jgi:DNA ligase-1
MAKALDAPYEAGNRDARWLKIKRVHTLDLVVLAAEWGHGRRVGQTFKSASRGPGSKRRATTSCSARPSRDSPMRCSSGRPGAAGARDHRDQWTVHVRPELVVEIAFSDLQASTRYPGGLALRLARVKRYRDDKPVEDRRHHGFGAQNLRRAERVASQPPLKGGSSGTFRADTNR